AIAPTRISSSPSPRTTATRRCRDARSTASSAWACCSPSSSTAAPIWRRRDCRAIRPAASMERREYERLAALDRRLLWFRGLHAQPRGAPRRRGGRLAGAPLLDAGCGTGGLLAALGEHLPQASAIGVELDPMAGAIAQEASHRPVCIGS